MDTQEKLLVQFLVLKAQMGDGRAYTQLIEHYHKRLLYYIRRVVDDEATAEDIEQNVWFVVFQKLPTLRDVDAFTAWLFRIARNQAAQMVRSLQKERSAMEEIALVEDIEETFEFPAQASMIHNALNKLTTEHREVLVLKYLEEMSYEEISTITGQKLGTVRSRIHYARQALKQAMEEIGHEFG